MDAEWKKKKKRKEEVEQKKGTAPGGPGFHPVHAAAFGEVAAQVTAPAERLGQFHVGLVPARVLHEGQRDARVDGILRVRPRHGFVLEGALLPVRQRRSCVIQNRIVSLDCRRFFCSKKKPSQTRHVAREHLGRSFQVEDLQDWLQSSEIFIHTTQL